MALLPEIDPGRQAGSPPVSIMISAGESSGEIHGAALMEAARARGLAWSFFGLGGDRMAAAGARLLAHIRETAVMGLTEVLSSAGRILALQRSLRQSLEQERPSALVLIDAPDFNFSLARTATALGIPVIYYICPQVWAWRPGRLKFLAANTRRRAVIFEFEKKFYEERGVSADWVGHPVLDELPPPAPRDVLKDSLGFDPAKRLLALLPGSRRQVAERLAPIFFETAAVLLEHDQHLELALPRADSLAGEALGRLVSLAPPLVQQRLRIFAQKSHQVLGAADLALVASGTASVEATLLGAPHLVAYQVSSLSGWLLRRLVSVPYVTIANLVAGREVVPEFVQQRATAVNLAGAAWPLLAGGLARARMVDDLVQVRRQLGEPGASGRVLDIIAEELTAGGVRS